MSNEIVTPVNRVSKADLVDLGSIDPKFNGIVIENKIHEMNTGIQSQEKEISRLRDLLSDELTLRICSIEKKIKDDYLVL